MDTAGEKGYDFDAAEIVFAAGGKSMRAVAAQFGIPEATLRRHARTHGWVKGASEQKRELVREALAGEPLDALDAGTDDAGVTQELTQSLVRQNRVNEATQDVADMNKGLEVARKVMDKLLQMVDGIESTADIKRICEANKAAIETIRKIRALDDDTPPELPETNVHVSVDPGFQDLRAAFKKRLDAMKGPAGDDAAAPA